MSCELHKIHIPKALTSELHHVIPQAWQNWKLGAERLFDKRTIELCPTGHRNVHYWLVRYMKGLDATPKKPNKEQAIALMAIQRWQDMGYSIEDLRAQKLWGQA